MSPLPTWVLLSNVEWNSAAGMNRYVSGGEKRGGLALVRIPPSMVVGVVTFVVIGQCCARKDLGPIRQHRQEIGAGDSSAKWHAAE